MSFRHSGYVTAIVAALALALLLVGIAQPKQAQAAGGTAVLGVTTMTADASTTILITDGDLTGAAGELALVEIRAASTGTAKFTASGGNSAVIINNGLGDADSAGGTITIAIKGLGTAGVILIDVTVYDGADGLLAAPATDGDTVLLGLTLTAAVGSVQIFPGTTSFSATVVAGTGAGSTVLSARVLTTTGSKAAAGTSVTWQAVGQGAFKDTVTAATTIPALVGGGAFSADAANASGCSAGEGTQSCTSAVETADDSEVIATAEPPGTGLASVHYEGAGVAGPVVWTARAGGAAGPTATASGTVFGAVASYAATQSATYIRNNGSATSNIGITAKDAGGNPVSGHIPASIAVTAPTAVGAAMGAAGGASGSTPSCAAGTSATGKCNVIATASTTQGPNTLRIGATSATSGVSATVTVTLVGANATLAILDAPASVVSGSSTVITAETLDASGDPGADGQSIGIVATGTGAVSPIVPVTAAGRTTFTFIAGEVEGENTILVTLGTLQATATLSVTGGTSAASPTGTSQTLNLGAGTQGVGWFGTDTTSTQLLADNATIERIWWLDTAGVWQLDSLVLPSSARVTIQITRGVAFFVVNSTNLALVVPLS